MMQITLFLSIIIISLTNQLIAKNPSKEASLNLDSLIHQVLEQNKNLEAAQARIKAASLTIPRVQIINDPQFTIMSEHHPFKAKDESSFMPRMTYVLSQMVPFPGKLRLKGKIAEQNLAMQKSEKITVQQELILQTKKLYFQLLLNHIAYHINQQNQNIVSRFIDGALALYKTGKGSQGEVLKAQIESQLLNDELLTLRSEQISIKSLINAILNCPQSESIGIPEKIFSAPFTFHWKQLEAIAISKRSELQEIQAKVKEQKFSAQLANREIFPDFTFSAMYKHVPAQHERAWGVGISFNLPLWFGHKAKQEAKEADTKALAYQNTLYDAQSMIRGQINSILARLHASEERIHLYRTGLIPTTTESLASFESRYRVGKGDFLILLDTRRQLQKFELDYERARIDREILLTELERALGLPLEEIAESMKKETKNGLKGLPCTLLKSSYSPHL